MKKYIKLLSVVLAVMLTMSVLTIMSVAVNAAENAENDSESLSLSTIDTPYDYDIDHIEVVSLPEKNEFIEGVYFGGASDSAFAGMEYNVYYTNGVIENYKYGESDFDNYTDVEFFTSTGEEFYYYSTSEGIYAYNRFPIGEYTVKFYHKLKHNYPHSPIEIAEYKINVIENTYLKSITSIEIIKNPDKVFTNAYISYEDWTGSDKEYADFLLENYIPYNMDGAQLQINLNDGTSYVYTFVPPVAYPIYMYKGLPISINDLGNYKAEVEYAGKTTVFEVNHIGAEPATPDNEVKDKTDGKNENGNLVSSDSAKSSTSDTATSDSAVKKNSDNGAIATGSVMYSFAAIIILVCACGVLLLFNRKRYLSK